LKIWDLELVITQRLRRMRRKRRRPVLRPPAQDSRFLIFNFQFPALSTSPKYLLKSPAYQSWIADMFPILFLTLPPALTFLVLRGRRMALRIAIAGLVFLLCAVALPNFVKARVTMSKSACESNLRLLQEGKRLWAETNRKSPTDVPSMSDLVSTLQLKVAPKCPALGEYTLGTVSDDVQCSVNQPGHTIARTHGLTPNARPKN
jgi:hypothetical protein